MLSPLCLDSYPHKALSSLVAEPLKQQSHLITLHGTVCNIFRGPQLGRGGGLEKRLPTYKFFTDQYYQIIPNEEYDVYYCSHWDKVIKSAI